MPTRNDCCWTKPTADLQTDPKRLWLLAISEENLGEYDQAREHFERPSRRHPTEPDYAKSLADLLVERFSESRTGQATTRSTGWRISG